ncbi:MAG: hypothetical protein QOK47_555, partial [Actinomycetota bacterium]|nr:hypothetical protein [Actinomycetota bacterium]
MLVTLVLGAVKVAVWATTSSLAILSQALDSMLDVISLGLLFVGLRIAGKPADVSHHYGHAKAENLVAFTQTLILAIVALGIAVTAISRLLNGVGEIDTPWYAFATLAVSGAIDAVRVRSLLAAARDEHSDALMAGALNIALDIGTAALAFLSLVLVRAGIQQADAIGGLIVACVVGVAAVRVGRRSVDVLMDRAPQASAEEIEAAARRA